MERWDNVKCLLIFLVVLGHICDPFTANSTAMRCIFMFIYTVHMPLFLFISGLFSKKNINEARYSKIFSYLVLYLVIKMLLSISTALANQQVEFSLFNEASVPWYALALFVYSIITVALRKFSHKYVFAFAIILSCFVGYDSSVSDFLALSRLFVFYPFFFAGYCLEPVKLEKIFANKMVQKASWVILVCWIAFLIWKIDAVYWIRPMLTGRNPYSVLEKYNQYGGAIRLLYYLIVFVLGIVIISVIPKKFHIKLISNIGRRTLQIYALHHVVINLVFGFTDIECWIEQVGMPYSVLAIAAMAMVITLVCSLRLLGVPFRLLMDIPKWADVQKSKAGR